MYLDAAKKQEIFGKYGKSNTDTGILQVVQQRTAFSYQHCQGSFSTIIFSVELQVLSQRRALLNYLKDRDIARYRAIVKELGLRK